MTATRRKPTMHLALPPRISMNRMDSGESSPCTPGPHTPLPYDISYFNDSQIDMMQLDETSVGVGSKRSRDEEDEKFIEPEWAEEEIDVLDSTLLHPFRPVSTSYPPGELPPPHVLDELTNQILNYAFRRNKHNNERSSSPPSDISTESTSSEHEKGEKKVWKHSWDFTRKKLFEIALAESKFGHAQQGFGFGFDNDENKKKPSREERLHSRPGLRRVDSMDFLDQKEDDSDTNTSSSENVGRAIRLSTSLQNSAKQEPLLLSLSRSTSLGSGLTAESPICPSESSPLPLQPQPSMTSITLTPASPTGPSQPLRRKPSFRSSSSRPLRPASLLQRGRSFTAEDLRAEAEDKDRTSIHGSENGEQSNAEIATSLTSTSEITTSPIEMLSKTEFMPLPKLPSDHNHNHNNNNNSKLTRSYSSSSVLYPQPHTIQKLFLSAPIPSTNDRSKLALPLPDENSPLTSSSLSPSLSPSISLSLGPIHSETSANSNWSDSEDESIKQPRKIKKLKQTKKTHKPESDNGLLTKSPMKIISQLLPGQGPGELALRSPFEEKDEPQFV
ncbi:uncharacterized protein IL334_007064 [Kwoniella shivajii]|uniref:Uncharacterized protein n=1 Tax=Kwoniella shivajii TaxID=564305 RepID=A0ABZ1D9R5_9TREE|nr:hypothetical protein IL334_007064 [Kwoniella shivajii]